MFNGTQTASVLLLFMENIYLPVVPGGFRGSLSSSAPESPGKGTVLHITALSPD